MDNKEEFRAKIYVCFETFNGRIRKFNLRILLIVIHFEGRFINSRECSNGEFLEGNLHTALDGTN